MQMLAACHSVLTMASAWSPSKAEFDSQRTIGCYATTLE